MNIAIFSPNKNPYSETFIQAHKKYLKDKVFYYFGNKGRIKLEGHNNLVSKGKRWRYRIVRKLKKHSNYFIVEQSVLASLKEQAIDVVLVEYGTHAFNLDSLLKQSGLPVVVHFHGYDASVSEVIKGCNDYIEVFNLASRIVAVSRKMEERLLSLGCPREKLVYNVYGPQPEFESVQPTYSKIQFISIGRFTDKKAPYYTILAFQQILDKHPEACLLLAGNGVLLNMCQNLVKYLHIEDKVKFLGVVSPNTYRQLLSESLAFVQHSITAKNGDMEGTPLAVLEASAAGLPVIATKHAGIPDVIMNGETGLLCEEHDVKAMAENMVRLLDNVLLAKQLGSFGKEHIIKNYNLKRHINGLQKMLEEVVKHY